MKSLSMLPESSRIIRMLGFTTALEEFASGAGAMSVSPACAGSGENASQTVATRGLSATACSSRWMKGDGVFMLCVLQSRSMVRALVHECLDVAHGILRPDDL